MVSHCRIAENRFGIEDQRRIMPEKVLTAGLLSALDFGQIVYTILTYSNILYRRCVLYVHCRETRRSTRVDT